MSVLLASNSANGQPTTSSVRPSCVGHAAKPDAGGRRPRSGRSSAVRSSSCSSRTAAAASRCSSGADGPRDERMPAVRADDHPRVLGDVLPPCVAANAGDAAVLDETLIDSEPLAHLRLPPRMRRRPGACRARSAAGHTRRGSRRSPGAPGDGERSQVERVRVDRRAPGCHEPVEQAPSLQRRHSGRMDEVRRDRVARERRPVDDQHAVALAAPEASRSASQRNARPPRSRRMPSP